jgi:hypothetical protein
MNSITQLEIREKVVAIVRFGPGGSPADGMKPGEYYQVTIDPRCISPSGEFIRFGQHPGDQIVGWQRCKAMSVEEVLGKWEGSEPPVMEYGASGVVLMMSHDPIEVPAREV